MGIRLAVGPVVDELVLKYGCKRAMKLIQLKSNSSAHAGLKSSGLS